MIPVRDGFLFVSSCLSMFMRASFLFVGDLNGHHQEWLRSSTANYHGVGAFDFAIMSACYQLVVGTIHARGGTLDLLIADFY